ncbi:hypothetical protein ACEQ8H_005909 [Pleosporales sp. CAS-2024a]
MLPPVDPRVLESNPNLEVLYKDLTTRKLNPDGSTRDTKKQRIHDGIRSSLADARKSLISTQILLQSLRDLPSRSIDLPHELHSVIEIVLAQLNGHVSVSDREVLTGDNVTFFDNISTISDALSTQLVVLVDCLCNIADPKSPPAISDLSMKAISLLNESTQILPQELATARINLTNTISELLTTHLKLLSTAIRIMEQTQHGALARHTKSSAELLHTRATILGLQAKIHLLAHAPPPEFVAALKEYKKSQGTGEKALRDREGMARRSLELYERAGEKGMRDLARRKKWLASEISSVEAEITKLES